MKKMYITPVTAVHSLKLHFRLAVSNFRLDEEGTEIKSRSISDMPHEDIEKAASRGSRPSIW